jgi:hypothetical protein
MLYKFMNRKLVAGLCAVALACSAIAQQLTYENAGFISAPPAIPPNIDAYNFVNDGTFIINLTNQIWLLPPFQSPLPYEMQNVRNYTNSAGMFMSFNTGFRVDTFDPNFGVRQPASIVDNEGIIHCGTSDTFSTLNFEGFFGITNLVVIGSAAGSKFLLSADTLINPGDLEMGFESVCSLNANTINMDHGFITMETNGFSAINFGFLFNALIFDGYWGLNTNPVYPSTFVPAAFFERNPPITPFHVITNRNYLVDANHQLGGPTFQAYLSDTFDATGSNRFVRAVFLNNTNAQLQANVFFPIGATVIEWTNTTTALGNNLYLFDTFLYQTNFQLLIDGFSGPRPTYIPFNFNFFELPGGFLFLGPPATPTVIPAGTFDRANITNEYAAYEGLFQPTSIVLSDTFGQTYSNSPGRIELTATNYLTMNNALLSSLNFLRVAATNQFGGSAGAKVSAPYSEFNLNSTNGMLAITNLTVPTLNRDEGICDLYSARWTNVVGSVTNNFNVLFVDSRFSPYAPTRVVNLTLRCTNVFGGDDNMIISDVLNIVSNNVLLECSRLTITTNTGPGASAPTGGLNFLNQNVVWSDITPRLQFLTNNGFINAPSTMFFRGSRTAPYYSTNFNERYDYFLNRGGVTNFSSRIYSAGFQNSGTFFGTGGAIELHQCGSALLTNAAFLASGRGGFVTIESGGLLISNYVIQTGAAINLNITNVLDDGSISANSADYVSNKNFWITGNAINLLHLPANGTLLATTVSNTAPLSSLVPITWAAIDEGTTPEGFANNNGAIGRLILGGDLGSFYIFRPANGTNAIYIDQLELRDFVATNVDNVGNFLSLTCDPNMKVYFGQALANGRSIAEKLPLVNNHCFLWVSNYNTGFFSSTNVIYPDGTTNRLNTALVTSCDIDSNGNGIPNCSDPAPIPILTPGGLALSVTYTNQPSPAAVVSWTVFPNTANSLYSASTANSTNWQLVTNFVYQGSLPNRATVTDVVKTNAPRFYRVRAGSP